jgi:hypothetical protein
MATGDKGELERISKQLEDVKRLLIVQLIATGVQTAHIGKALGLDPSRISQLVPVRDIQTAVRRSKGQDG